MKVKSYNLEMDADRHPMMVAENEYETEVLNIGCPNDIDTFCRDSLRMDRMCEEYVYMICMNTKGKIAGIFPLSHGNACNAIVGTRETMMRALLCGAMSCALVHNHPSGDTTPSKEDFAIAKKIKEAGDLMGVSMVDFMIVGDDYYSFLEHEDLA